MAGPSQDDPLAETAAAGSDSGARPVNATATSAVSIPVVPAAPEGAPKTIGRYQIDGQLGQGAMGVVFAAHDPDLERKIALKILRAGGSEAARARLLREARAMARLSHPAVVTVHEVGTAGGVDYVAMELVDGTTVHEWIASAMPSTDEILDAFDTAGRGLAAAHAAGLVHRDFKPHNVLRSKRGRVVVTDFGLARAALEDPDVAATVPGGGAPADLPTDHGSLSSTLTATGAVLGTPAYMAPEQHEGASVGPAADQFAYCVALWEALAGARPFPGQTLAAVRQQFERGPDPASEAKIPRRLRAPLRRGLSTDPAARFPTMDALLAVIRRRRQGRVWAVAAASAVVVAAAVFFVATGGRAAPAALPGCGPVDRELAVFRTAPARARLVSDDARAQVARVDAQAAEWADIQRAVCANRRDPYHARRATCLAAVRGHLETAIEALALLSPDELHDADPALVGGDPRTCADPAGPPARVVIEHEPAEVAILAALLGNRARRDALDDPGDAKPCLRGSLLMGRLMDFQKLPHDQARQYIAWAAVAADRCGDDALAASVTLFSLSADAYGMIQDPAQSRRIAAAVERSRHDRFLAVIGHLLEGLMASFRQDIDGAIEKLSRCADDAAAIGSHRMVAACNGLAARFLFARAAPGDVATAEKRLRDGIAGADVSQRPRLQNALIEVLQFQGRGAEAQEVLAARRDPDEASDAPPGSIRVTGKLVDDNGAPVEGARVVAAQHVVMYPDQLDPTAPSIATAVTAADGTYTIESAAPRSVVMAADGDRRSAPVAVAPTVDLRLVPTGSVFGRVTTSGTGLGRVEVAVEPLPPPADSVDIIAPIAADGTWRIEEVPRGKAKVVLAWGNEQRRYEFKEIVVGAAPVGPIELEVAQRGVPIHVIIRNQVQISVSLGLAIVIRGKVSPKVLSDLEVMKTSMMRTQVFPVNPSEAPAVVRDKIEDGDALVRMTGIEPGDITVCGLGITGELGDPQYMNRVERHAHEMALGCAQTTVTSADQVILVEVPPMKRLPED